MDGLPINGEPGPTTQLNGEPGPAAQPDLDFGTTAPAAKPSAFRSPEPAPTTSVAGTTPAGPTTDTAPEANVRTLGTPTPVGPAPVSPAPVGPAVEPKPRPAPVATAPAAEPKRQPAPTAATPTPTTAPAPTPGTPAPAAPSSPVEITCREERLDITTEWHVVGTAKLRKYVTTERVERRVPVVRERVRVERTPVSEAERAPLTEKELAEAVEEVTLREERAVVRKHVVPIERVRLVVERYSTEEVIRDELRREHVEIHDDAASAATAAPSPLSPPSTPTPTTSTSENSRPAPLRPFV
ncbi:DUF2382 domain-containing protein [Kitasatospora sp. SUK 42]|uniref:YsnF/AvaK domain-containing protein n=1 Tax=Kitasatospora sp. SUK 42 TaxID=1588882 RepID=UPI0035AC00DD